MNYLFCNALQLLDSIGYTVFSSGYDTLSSPSIISVFSVENKDAEETHSGTKEHFVELRIYNVRQ